MNVPIDHVHQIAAALSGENRSRVHRRENTLSPQGFRKHCPGVNTVSNISDVPLENGILDLRFEKIQRPKDRQAGLDKSRKLLIEDDELVALDLVLTIALAEGERPAFLLHRDREQPLLLQFVTHFLQRLAVLRHLNDLTAGFCVSAVEFHALNYYLFFITSTPGGALNTKIALSSGFVSIFVKRNSLVSPSGDVVTKR